MLARFRVLLPYAFSIPYHDYTKLKPLVFQHGEYEMKAYPPLKANVDSSVSDVTSPIPLMDAISDLNEEKIITPISAIKINGHEIIKANLLQIDLIARRDFSRVRGQIAKGKLELDPPVELLFQLANSVIGRLRAVGRLSSVKFVTPDNSAGWRIEYLRDDGQSLPKDETLFRSHFEPKLSWQVAGITSNVWELASGLRVDFTPQVWDMLLLDAHAQLPDVNTSIVLANAALESFITISLNILAEDASVAPESWEWLTTRGDDWRKQPSAKEKYDQVLFLITGRSLKKEKADLWETFNKLRAVRNSIVHQGKAVIKTRKAETEVSPEMAKELVAGAGLIISWVESILPEEKRRIFFSGDIHYSFNRPATGPENSGTELWGFKGNLDGMKLSIGDAKWKFGS
jgi:hypothetical protein